MATKRIPYLDNIKGVLIVLVIIGHAIQYCSSTYEMDFAFRLIYSFHMPLFFFVSGYLANKGRWDRNLIPKRAIQLLLPFVTWAFISPLLKTGTFDLNSSIQTLVYPDNGLWFLYNLFLYSSIFNVAEYVQHRFGVKHWILVGSLYGVLGVLTIVFHTKFNCAQLCYHIVFYAAGYYYRQFKKEALNSSTSICVMGGGFVITVPFWVTNGAPLLYEWINLGGAFAYAYRYGVQFVGMMLFYGLGRKFLVKEIPILQKLGASTLGIYAVQFPLIQQFVKLLPIEEFVLKIVVISILAVPTSYMFVRIVRKVKYARLLLIGEK